MMEQLMCFGGVDFLKIMVAVEHSERIGWVDKFQETCHTRM